MRRFIFRIFGVFWALFGFMGILGFAGLALAGDPFTVGGVKVDATASTAIEAQSLAIQDGQHRAATMLLKRLTLERERLEHPLKDLSTEEVGRMIRALEVGQEKRSSNRYLGEITVAFNPSQVQRYLREASLTMVSSQAQERLVVIAEAPSEISTLRSVLASPRYSYALTPLRPISQEDAAQISTPISDTVLQGLSTKYGLNQVLVVEMMGAGQASLRDMALDRGESQSFFVRAASSDPIALADEIVAQLEMDWKRATAVVASETVTAPVSVLFNSHAGWLSLQQAINSSAQIRDARLDALSKDGALMTIAYGGDLHRLTTELRYKGVTIEQDPDLGLVLTRSR